MHALSPLRPHISCLILLALTGCADGMARYPSLAQRPAERDFAAAAPTPPAAAPAPAPAPATPDAAIVAQAAALRAAAVRADATFAQRAEEARRLVAAHAGEAHRTPGSEAWSNATVALAALDSARSDTALALADLDALRLKTAVTAAATSSTSAQASYQAVTDADSAAAALLGREDDQIDTLHKALDR